MATNQIVEINKQVLNVAASKTLCLIIGLAGSTNGLTIQLTNHVKQSVAGVYILAAYPFKQIPPTTNGILYIIM